MYVYLIDKTFVPKVYSSLKKVCEDAGVSYSSASRGKMFFFSIDSNTKETHTVDIIEVEHIKIQGRGKYK